MKVLRLICQCGKPLADVTQPRTAWGELLREHSPTEPSDVAPKLGVSMTRFDGLNEHGARAGRSRAWSDDFEAGVGNRITWTLIDERGRCRRHHEITGESLQRLWDTNRHDTRAVVEQYL